MRIVHLATDSKPITKKPTQRELDLKSAQRFIDLQEHANYKKALAENKEVIDRIRMRDKNFMPVKA